jgi:hypothetical protein
MRKTLIALSVMALLALAGAAALAQSGGGFDLSWNTVDGGGGASSGNGYELRGTIGQADAGQLSGGGYTLSGGFWGGICAVAVPAVTAADNGGALELDWSGGGTYDVYRGTSAYFDPAAPAYASGVSAPWTDPDANALGDPATNYYYVLLGGGCAVSNRVGAFDFALVPGT